ncbi:uncharacterized protein LOC135929177 isoform X4 [Gordionus sp. m RMFG-2023]|uniref:uncharacterized protein LOC135929177 isoform X4 n=1 Tax=Gordionus sp. m RMFG-2023 TaxID=3053472 RepID=UPI0031FBAB47
MTNNIHMNFDKIITSDPNRPNLLSSNHPLNHGKSQNSLSLANSLTYNKYQRFLTLLSTLRTSISRYILSCRKKKRQKSISTFIGTPGASNNMVSSNSKHRDIKNIIYNSNLVKNIPPSSLRFSKGSLEKDYSYINDIMKRSGFVNANILTNGNKVGSIDLNFPQVGSYSGVDISPSVIVFIFGGPGSFKSEIASNIIDMFEYEYISANNIILEYLMTHLDNQMLPSELKEYAEHPIRFAISLSIGENRISSFVSGSTLIKRPKYTLNKKKGHTAKLTQNSVLSLENSNPAEQQTLQSSTFEGLLESVKKPNKLNGETRIDNDQVVLLENELSEGNNDKSEAESVAKANDEEEKCRLKRRIFKYQQNSEDFLQYFRTSSRLVIFDVASNDFGTIWRRVRRFMLAFHDSTKAEGTKLENVSLVPLPILLTTLPPSIKNAQQIHLIFNFKSWSIKPSICKGLNIKQVKLQNICKLKRLESPERNLEDLLHYVSKECFNTQEMFVIDCSKTSLMNIPFFLHEVISVHNSVTTRAAEKKNKKGVMAKRSKHLLFLESNKNPIRLSEIAHIYLHGLGGSSKKLMIANLISTYRRQLNAKFFSVKASQNITCYYQLETSPKTYTWITYTLNELIKNQK